MDGITPIHAPRAHRRAPTSVKRKIKCSKIWSKQECLVEKAFVGPGGGGDSTPSMTKGLPTLQDTCA